MSRVRLTERRRRAVEDDIPYPGIVNQPERKFKRVDQYDNYQETPNHPTPDMRHEWQDNPRDEIGFGIPKGGQPTVASVRIAAGKAVKMAVLLLGEKVAEEVIEDQARDFMSMSSDAMDRTLGRFAETQELYASDDDDEDDEDDESMEASEEETKDEESKEEETKEAAEEETKDEDSKEAAEEETKDEESKEAAEEETEEEESKEASDDEDEDDEGMEASEEEETEEIEVEASERKSTDMDIELMSSVDEVTSDPESEAQLASLFEDESVVAAEKKTREVEGSEKAGIKKLGGQPKVASKSAMADISSIWDSAPDVSGVFE